MKKQNIIRCYILVVIFCSTSFGCKKFLAEKSDQKLVIITKARDLQSLLDNYNNVINSNTPSADIISSDEYYLTADDYESLFMESMRNMYTWQPYGVFEPRSSGFPNDWSQVYDNVNIANTVLDNMGNVARTGDNAAELDDIKGQALFLRAFSFYKCAGIWSIAFDSNTANTDLGIPLRLNSNFNEASVRSSLKQTYDQIIDDALASKNLLSQSPIHVYRSSKPAAFALLANVYLSMRNYNVARLYADSCLQLKSDLIDYNELNLSNPFPIPQFNKEVIYDTFCNGISSYPISLDVAKVDSILYKSYANNDLRKSVFFSANDDGTQSFRGSYHGDESRFNGFSVDEIFLIRAECSARQGILKMALDDLNKVLAMRYKSGKYVSFVSTSTSEVLNKILEERKKELIFRGTRWVDIKRLNKEGAGISLKRVLNGTVYSIPPNSLKFALPIPEDVISISGIKQNLR